MASPLRKKKPSPPKPTSDRPASWQPFAQFREVVESESLAGQAPQAILVPSPAVLSSNSPPPASEWPIALETPRPHESNSPGDRHEGARPNSGAPTGFRDAPWTTAATALAEPVPSALASPPLPIQPSAEPFGWTTGTSEWLRAGNRPPDTTDDPTPSYVNGSAHGSVNGVVNGVSLRPGPTTAEPESTQPESEQVRTEGIAAMRNAITLGSSLVFTTAIGFLINLYYQAHLGPSRAGRVAAAESLAVTSLIVLAFGLDNYPRKEVALRPDHAKEFVPGVLVARLIATVPFTAVLMAVMALVGRPREVIILLALFGGVRFLVHSNELLAACLHAVGSVRGLSRQNLLTKAAWGVAILVFLFTGFGVYSVPMGWIVGESLKLFGLSRRTGRELQIWSQTGDQHIKVVLRRSVPFLSSSVLTALAMVLDLTMMQFLATEDEVGYYRFAQSLLLLVLILATVLPWVLLPMASKAVGRSAEEFTTVMRRSLGSVMALSLPLCVLLCLNADTIINTLAPKFDPSIPALRILALTAIGTYLTLVCATFLQAQGKTWLGVRIGVFIVAFDAVLVLAFVGMGHRVFGAGGAGTAAALAILVAEFTGTALYVKALGRNAWDREALQLVGRVLLATVPVVLADRFMAAKGFSIPRAFADVVVYGLNILLLRVIEPAKLLAVAKRARH